MAATRISLTFVAGETEGQRREELAEGQVNVTDGSERGLFDLQPCPGRAVAGSPSHGKLLAPAGPASGHHVVSGKATALPQAHRDLPHPQPRAPETGRTWEAGRSEFILSRWEAPSGPVWLAQKPEVSCLHLISTKQPLPGDQSRRQASMRPWAQSSPSLREAHTGGSSRLPSGPGPRRLPHCAPGWQALGAGSASPEAALEQGRGGGPARSWLAAP